MCKVYGFCGRKRSGKSELANVVAKKYDGSVVTVANYLKTICCHILKCSLDTLNEQKDNGTTFSKYPDEEWYDIIECATNIDRELVRQDIGNIEFTNIRQMLQVIGTDCIRKHKPNWHVDCMKDEIKRLLSVGKTVAIDDIRFPNELEAVKELGGECFFLVRPLNEGISNHISETSLTWDMFDDRHIIINNDTKNSLIARFIKHLDNGFKESRRRPILLSEQTHYYNIMDASFGKVMDDLVEEVVRQNKDNNSFRRFGLISFKPLTHEMNWRFNKAIYKRYNLTHEEELMPRTLYNPLINENLKIYL